MPSDRFRGALLLVGRVVAVASLLAALLFFGRSVTACSAAESRVPSPPRVAAFDFTSPLAWPQAVRTTLAAVETFSPFGFNLACALFFLWLSGRCYLYVRFRAGSRLVAEEGKLPERLLSNQRLRLDELLRTIEDQKHDKSPTLVALQGDWGSGKSTIVRALRRRLEEWERDRREKGNRPVVVYVDIWRHSTEPDLHLALLEELLSHPRVPVPPAFFRYPLSLLPVIGLRNVTKIFDRGQFEVSGFRASLTLPALLWQKTLERIVAQVVRRHGAIVWILDEIDRCTPEMAQAAIALTRRALSLPGTVIVLPYVREQLRYKVFNPLISGRSDLASTMRALVWEHASQKEGGTSRIFAKADSPWDESWSPRHFGPGDDRPALFDRGRSALVQSEPTATVERMLNWGVSRQFIELDIPERLRLEYLFEEKYLARQYQIGSLRDDEVAEMLLKFELLRKEIGRLVERAQLSERLADLDRHLEKLVPSMLDRYRQKVGKRAGYQPGRRSPTIRHLEGEIFAVLGLVPLPPAELPPEERYRLIVHDLLFAVLVAYRRAWEIVTWRPWKG